MNECRRIEALLPPYVDGDARPDELVLVDAHIAGCALCRAEIETQRTVRAVLRARAGALATAAPPGLRTRLVATLEDSPSRARTLGWRARLTAFAAAAAMIIVIVSALELVVPRSNSLLAAQLAIDHVRCFIVELASTEGVDPEKVEREYAEHYGWSITVPASNQQAGLTLVAARRCPFWVGEYAHLLYRSGDDEVSLYVVRADERPPAQLKVLGHVERIWTARGNSYALVARGVDAQKLAAIAAYLENRTRTE